MSHFYLVKRTARFSEKMKSCWLFSVFYLCVALLPFKLRAEGVTVRIGAHFIGFEGFEREALGVALREELNRALNEGEQQAEGASAQIPLPESWETVISTYQKHRRNNNYWLTRKFNSQQITRRAELLEEVSPLPVYGVFTGESGHQVRYLTDENTLYLRTPPGSNLRDNAGFLDAPENILSEVLNRPARYDLLEALIAAHSYLFTSYREARNYAESQESSDYVCCPPHRFWAIEDLVLTIHVISRQLMTLPNNLAAETPLSELLDSRQPTSGDLTMHFSGERFRLNSLIGQADLEFNQCLKFVIELLEFYKQRLQGQDASGHASGDASVTKVLADLDLLMLSMRQALIEAGTEKKSIP